MKTRYLSAVLVLLLLLSTIGCVEPVQAPDLTPTPPPTPTPAPTPTPSPVPEEQITVTRVIDGDTIDVDIGGVIYRVRYIGIDTPELGEPGADEATEANRRLVEGRVISLEKDVSDTDRYGRLLRYVYLDTLSREEVIRAWGTSLQETRAIVYLFSLIDQGEPLFINAILVALGYARVYTYPPDIQYNDYFLELQEEAQRLGWGIWALPPSPPLPPQPTQVENVQITYIFYDGIVPQVESDEYVEITHLGNQPQDLVGWVLLDVSEGYPSLTFPSYILAPGASIRVYTNEYHPEWGGFSFGHGKAIWNNTVPDTAVLYDSQGNEVSRKSY